MLVVSLLLSYFIIYITDWNHTQDNICVVNRVIQYIPDSYSGASTICDCIDQYHKKHTVVIYNKIALKGYSHNLNNPIKVIDGILSLFFVWLFTSVLCYKSYLEG